MPTVIFPIFQFSIAPLFNLTNQWCIKEFRYQIHTATDYSVLKYNNTDVTVSIQHHSLGYYSSSQHAEKTWKRQWYGTSNYGKRLRERQRWDTRYDMIWYTIFICTETAFSPVSLKNYWY